MTMLEWCNQSDPIGDFKGTAADMAAHEARKNVGNFKFEGVKDYGYTRDLERQIKEKDKEIIRLNKIIDKFIVKSNGLSVYVRSDMFGRSNLPRLDEKLWELYNFQCEVEFGENNESDESDTDAVPV